MNSIFNKATKDKQSITADWVPFETDLIDGVKVKEVKNVLKNNGFLTEIYRNEWHLDEMPIGQIFQVTLIPGGLSAWHAHEITTDRLFVNQGTIRVVLYDGREDSATYGRINEFRVGLSRPMLIIVPPKVWHGVYNHGSSDACLLNIVDKPYVYEDPDHWRLPADTPEIPYRFY